MADWKGTYRISNNNSVDESSIHLATVPAKLQKREEERQEKLRKKQAEDDSFKVQESLQIFLDTLKNECSKLEKGLSDSKTVDRAHLAEHFDQLSHCVTKLQRFVSESAMFLPPYELKTAQNVLVSLQNKIQEKRDEMLPKKKFTFKKTNKKSEKKIAGPACSLKSEETIKDFKSDDDLVIELAACKFVDATNEILRKDADQINLKDVALARLNECTVLLCGAPSAIHVNKLKNCKVFCGPVPGSIFIRDCENCTFVLACQQLRIHSTTKSHFYIHVTSKAIIEDCNTVKFAPFNWSYELLDHDYEKSGLSKDRNNWDKVDDFNWLAADLHSPNWTILEETERVSKWNV